MAKTAMIGVKTSANLGVAVEELAEVMEPVLEQMENDVRNTLDVLCWDEDQVEAYLVSGRLPLWSRWMGAAVPQATPECRPGCQQARLGPGAD